MGHLDKRYWIVALVVLFLMVFMAGVKYAEIKDHRQKEQESFVNSITEGIEGPKEESEMLQELPQEEILIEVHVSGEVINPGIYKLKPGSRVYQAVEMAGGVKESADIRLFGMAQELVDGETVCVPAQGENGEAFSGGNSSAASSTSGRVNINRASADEMADKLSGIGPALSQRIVDYRNSNGPFKRIEDIKNVSGIGDKRFDDIKDSISVR